MRAIICLSLLGLGCVGTREVPPPATAAGYARVDLRNVAPMGFVNANVSVEAIVGAVVPEEICDGLVTFPALLGAPGGLPTGFADVTLTIARARWAEVRELKPFDHVRVRGYVSTWFAEGCDWFSRTAHRYLWIDSIERL